MASKTTLIIFAVVVSSLLIIAEAAVEDWEEDLLWPDQEDYDTRKSLMNLLFRKRNSDSRYQSK